MPDEMSIQEYRHYQQTGKLPKRFEKQTRSSVLSTIADAAPDLLDQAVNAGQNGKYGNTPTEVDGYVFDSKAEAARYSELKQMMLGGLIANLELQPKFELTVQGVKIGTYSADFRYRDLEKGIQVVEDVKSVATAKKALYRWKKKHVEAQYGVRIVEVTG